MDAAEYDRLVRIMEVMVLMGGVSGGEVVDEKEGWGKDVGRVLAAMEVSLDRIRWKLMCGNEGGEGDFKGSGLRSRRGENGREKLPMLELELEDVQEVLQDQPRGIRESLEFNTTQKKLSFHGANMKVSLERERERETKERRRI